MRRHLKAVNSLWLIVAVVGLTAGCETAKLPFSAGVGANPTLPPPNKSLIPTVIIAPAKGWPDGAKPLSAKGTSVNAFATGLDHPRWIFVLPNGDVLVAETAAPPQPDDNRGFKGWIMKKEMKRVGAGVPSANRITLLRDADGDGVAEVRTVFLEGLNSPFGMALVGSDFYVANTDAVMRFPYASGVTRISSAGAKFVDLLGGRINHHWTKNLMASRDGSKLYVTTGSNSNVGENGLDKEAGRAAIWEIDCQTGQHRMFASGLRNPNGLAWEPVSGALWTVVNERDELGSDLVPDYLTSVKDGAFYGWPYSYYGQHVDERAKPSRPDLVAKAIAPDYALGAHVAPSAWPGLKATACLRSSRLGCSSASTVRGTAGPAVATTWSLCPSAMAGRRGVRWRCSQVLSTPRATRTVVLSASRWTSAGRCWWPMTSATSSGASLPKLLTKEPFLETHYSSLGHRQPSAAHHPAGGL